MSVKFTSLNKFKGVFGAEPQPGQMFKIGFDQYQVKAVRKAVDQVEYFRVQS